MTTNPGGSNLQIQYNNAGAFGGATDLEYDPSTNQLNFIKGPGILSQIPASATGDAVCFSYVQESAYWTNGPSGSPNYYDDTMSWGWNIKSPQVPIDPTKGCVCVTMENLYYQSGVFAHEFHLQNVCIDGTQHRPMSFFIPTANGTSGQAGLTNQIDYIYWSTYGGTSVVEWNLFNKNVSFQNGFQLIFNQNNIPIMKQNNAAGSAGIALPYIDADTRLNFGAGFGFRSSAATPTGGDLPNSYGIIQPSSIASGGVILDKYAPTFTGSLYADRSTASITGDFTIALYNNANAAAANANIELRTIGTSAGDPSIKFNVNGGPLWQVGQDNSDSNKFKVSLTGFNPGSDQFAIAATSPYQATFLGPLQTPQYTVATLPAASVALKGCRAHVIDATSPTFLGALAGGGSVICPVFCNGTAWVAG